MKKKIFPKEIIENTIEVHQFKHTNNSKIIYGFILIMLIAGLVLLPFINITIYNTSQGFIRADKERIQLQSIYSGKVVFHQLKNNFKVKKGDTLLLMNTLVITQKIENTIGQLNENNSFINDLELLSSEKIKAKKLKSLKYKQEYKLYLQKVNELNIRFEKIKEDYSRSQNLFRKGVIARVTLANKKLEYDLALNVIHLNKKKQVSVWQSQLVNFKNQLKKIVNNQIELIEIYNRSIIKAPIAGTLLNVKGIEKGSFIPIGMQLAEISPQSELIVECYISPEDIGLLKIEDTVSFQVSAFNYNQWGLASGKIEEIGSDVQMINNRPMFRVLCSLNKDYLELKNGFIGHFKKGMVVNARFVLTERTLFNLLYDKMDDWLNPTLRIAEKEY